MLDIAPISDPVRSPSAVAATDRGREFVDAIVIGDFDRLESLLAPHVRFRALIPGGYLETTTAAGARAVVEDWFGDTDHRELHDCRVAPVGDRLALGYRIELTEGGERRIVEQHLAAIVESAVFCDIGLVCSGFRLVTAAFGSANGADGSDGSRDAVVAEAPVSTPAAQLDATGLSCATLTPTISATVRGLQDGAVLEIVTDDPEAEEGLRSWTRLTGHQLVAAEAGPGSTRRFSIRRSPRNASPSTRKGAL